MGVERIFVLLQIITAAYVAFAHGANDRSNAIGPMAAVYQVLESGGELSAEAAVPVLVGPPWKRWYSNRRNDLGLEGDGHNWKENHGRHSHEGFRSGIRGCDDHPDLFDAVPSRACINDTHLGQQ